jgi:SOS-response transcriptional repressor LexA
VTATKLQLQKGHESRLAILLFLTQCDHSPTVREIGDAVDLKSPSTVHHHLRILEGVGSIVRHGSRIALPYRSAA